MPVRMAIRLPTIPLPRTASSVERRLLLWFVTSTAFLVIYIGLNWMFVPPIPKKPLAKPNAANVADENADLVDAADAPTNAAEDEDDGVAESPRPKPALLTLGSMDPKSGFFILATLNNQGGAVERLELTERDDKGRLKYRRVDTTSGYLGYLAAETSAKSDGCVVRVVGPGTPASLAKPNTSDVEIGLMPGDLIVAANSKAITSPRDLERILEKTKPGDEIKLEVKRQVASADKDDAAAEDGASGDAEATQDGESSGSEADANSASPPKSIVFTTQLTEHPLDLIRLASTGGDDEVIGNLSRLACRVTLSHLGGKNISTGKSSLAGLEWVSNATYEHELKFGETQDVTFSLPLAASQLKGLSSEPLTITRGYSLAKGSYVIDMNVAVENNGKTPQQVAYRLEGPCGVTLEGWWYLTKISPNFFGGAAARDVVYNSDLEGHTLVSGYDLLKRAKKQPKEPDEVVFVAEDDEAARSVRYVGIDAQYFNVAYVPPKDTPTFKGFRQLTSTLVADASAIPVHKERAADVSFFLDSIVADLPPGAALRQPLRMYAGPKVPELIEPFGLDNTIEYGWFGGVSKILGGILHSLYSMVGNYAIAIVLLTVLVRACLFPVSRKAAIHAQRMQELAPELKKINDKYKDDMEGRLRAQRDFQKRVGFNPLAGCLPAFLQLPIFIGLYRCLSVDIELRQAAFASTLQWASNLAAPDMLYHWGDWLWDYLSGRGTGWLGPYFNILPVAVVVLFLIQQKMFMPPPTDEQQAVTQKVMTVMTMMMALFFFRVPAGLCIYFITSSLWGIAERIVVKKTIPQSKVALATGDVVEGTVTARTTPEKVSLADRIRNQMNPEPPKALPPAKRKKPPGKK